MTAPTHPPRPADEDRRVDRALFGNDPADAADGLPPETHDEFARLAAALTAPPSGAVAPPPALVERVKADANAFFAPAGTVELAREPERQPWWRFSSFTQSLLAVSICLVLFSLLYPPVVTRSPYRRSASFASLSEAGAERRLQEADDVLTLPLDAAGGEQEAETAMLGDVRWSQAEQGGLMRLTGLAPNDPAESQYQLWIFDADRDERYPVDGGVFDVPASGKAVVPFAPRVPVGRATLFAVSVERPGGVVVSDRSRLPATAKVPGA